jgi:hypothetical protein
MIDMTHDQRQTDGSCRFDHEVQQDNGVDPAADGE